MSDFSLLRLIFHLDISILAWETTLSFNDGNKWSAWYWTQFLTALHNILSLRDYFKQMFPFQ